MPECKNCYSGFRLQPDLGEKYCGFCGCSLKRLHQKATNIIDKLYYASYDKSIPLSIQLTNSGMFDINDISLIVNNDVYDSNNDTWLVCSNIPEKLNPGQTEIITLTITPSKHKKYKTIRSFTFLFDSQDDLTLKKEPVCLQFLDDPIFSFSPVSHEIEWDEEENSQPDGFDQELWKTISINVELLKSIIIIDDILVEFKDHPDIICRIKCDMIGRKLPFEKQNKFNIDVMFETKKIIMDKNYTVIISIKIKNHSKPFQQKFRLLFTRPPRLGIISIKNTLLKNYESIIHDIYSSSTKHFKDLDIINTGSGELFLEKIIITPEIENLLEFEIDLRTPVRISTKVQRIHYKIKTSQIKNNTIQLNIQFCYFYENEKKDRQDQILEKIMIINLKKFNQGRLMAVDFGTTNSYCAMFLEWHKMLELAEIPEDQFKEKEESVLPTSISYFISDPKNMTIGRMAYFHYRTGESNAFRSFKRNLASNIELNHISNEDYWIQYHDNKSPKKVTAEDISFDFLNEFINRVRAYSGYQFSNYVFSHPTCFPLPKIISLKKIIKDLGINTKEYCMIDEATSSALDFIPDYKGKYYLLVYDFGGGTIDIAFLEVNNLNNKKIYVDLIDLDGISDFGGDDITEVIVQKICKKIISKSSDNSFLIKRQDTSYDSIAEQYLKKNMKSIWVFAEEMKKNRIFSEEEINITSYMPQLYCSNSDQKRAPTRKKIEKDLIIKRHEIEEIIFKNIKESIDLVNDIFDNHSKIKGNEQDLNEHERYILLSGRSSAIPMVKKLFEEYKNKNIPIWDSQKKEINFKPDSKNKIKFIGNEKIIISDRSKSCVARGASTYARSFFSSTHVEFILSGISEQTTSRFGFVEHGVKMDDAVFIECIPKNRLLVPEDEDEINKNNINDYAIYNKAANFKFNENGKLLDPITIYQHFGKGNSFNTNKCCVVGKFQINKPDACKSYDITGRLKIQIMMELEIKVFVEIYGLWYDAEQII